MKTCFTLYLLGILYVILGCKKNEDFFAAGLSYYPLIEGSEKIYYIQEEKYVSGNPETIKLEYFEKHIVNKVEVDLVNNIRKASVNVWKSDRIEGGWNVIYTYSTELNPSHLLITKDNNVTMNLNFPIQEGKVWNGNLYNNNGTETFLYRNLNKELEVDSDKWSGTIEVVQREKATLIDLYNKVQYYAMGVGLVYDEDVALEYCQEESCIGQEIIDSGYSKITKLIKY